MTRPGEEDWFQFIYLGKTYYFLVEGFDNTETGPYGLTFNLNANQLTIETLASGGTTTDTKLTLYDSNASSQLAFDDDGGTGLLSLLTYALPVPQPNLAAVAGTPSLSVNNQTQVDISLSVENDGGSVAAASSLGYYLSTDQNIDLS